MQLRPWKLVSWILMLPCCSRWLEATEGRSRDLDVRFQGLAVESDSLGCGSCRNGIQMFARRVLGRWGNALKTHWSALPQQQLEARNMLHHKPSDSREMDNMSLMSHPEARHVVG